MTSLYAAWFLSDMTSDTQIQTKTRHVAIFGFSDVLLMDVTGPAQVFGSANKLLGYQAYRIDLLTRDGDDVRTDTGLTLRADGALDRSRYFDDLVIPGGPGVDRLLDDATIAGFLVPLAGKAQRVVSVCSGSLLTAAAGLLDGRRATTHWERSDLVHKRFAEVDWHLDRIFTRDGRFYCSAGVTAGIDLALSLLEADQGRDTALAVAREMVVFMHRHGGQSQYSRPLQAQSSSQARFAGLYSRIEADPAAFWTVQEMARAAGTTERTLHRECLRDLGMSPARFVEERRLAIARLYLERSEKPFKQIASLSGFGSEQKMRRSFAKRLGVLPTDYRERFGESTAKADVRVTSDT